MSNLASLRKRLSAPDQTGVNGNWRTISACLDEDTGEYLNVGVLFKYSDKVEVRMLDSFERIKCLYGQRIDHDSLHHLMLDIEETIRRHHSDLPDELSDTIRLGEPLYASGVNPESVVDEFFLDVVTLGVPIDKHRNNNFRYKSNHKVRETLFEIMREKMALEADHIICNEPYRLKLNNRATIDVDVPLLNEHAAGAIVSAWYKSPIVVENNLLQAASDLLLVASNSDRERSSMSVLMPQESSGMSRTEFTKHQDITRRLLDRYQRSGIDIIEAPSSDVLANLTIDWWKKVA
ncbi:hypothetical protein [Pseudomonas sp. TTU2014-080ASC]|uniref:hypothetical protein n=1 Tax=Pseudomonas sp. TTU2014-080ASC TaxID=1729724 RepID=UPI0007187120|nr:hypothetical protein [Pseudomonas sp. TTU2014-080ASC]KRW62359.1 hypothetical protein AO726_02750 [Pseudomonas sp. TTU2014-080ASC]